MRRAAVILMLVAGLAGASSCRSDPAAELLETAKFEELQQNRTHARELYERILRDHGESPAAAEARARLEALSAP